jgi:hypothetical protein
MIFLYTLIVMSKINRSKRTKANRVKQFTRIRHPYKSYQLAEWNWNDVFIELDQLKYISNTYLRDISIKYGILYKTLSNKYYAYCEDKENMFLKVDNENRGGSNKIFSLQQEEELYDDIKSNYIDKNRPLTNEIIKQLAIKKHKFGNNDTNFNASNGWCSKFKSRWNMSTQKVKPSKTSNKTTRTEIDEFLDTFNEQSTRIKKRTYLIMMKQTQK